MKWLWEHDLIHSTVKDEVERMVREEFVFPPDILDRIRQDEMAWENYQTYSGSYQRICVAYIDAARKRPEEFEKRLTNFLSKTRENKMIAGYGGIDKYY